MSKYSWTRNAIEFIGFNCLLIVISGSMLHINESNIWALFMITLAKITFSNIFIFSLLSVSYVINKTLLKRSTPPLLERILGYSLTSFALLGIGSGILIFFIPTTSNGQSLYLFLVNGALGNLRDSLANLLAGKVNIIGFLFNFCFVGLIPILSILLPSWIITGILIANQGWLYGGNKVYFLANKLENLRTVARQMLVMGNIKQAERLYKEILEILDSLEEVKKAVSEVFDFNILGIDISFSNPFIKENNAILPLILVQQSYGFSLEIIQDLTDRAIIDNRNFDLALLYCCQGKILVDRGNIDIGFSLLHNGIYIFEGIRNSINNDRLGVGFGDGYLKFYDWAIDAAIQTGNIHQAFDYSEHAKARAMLDLLCQRTSNRTSEALQDSLVELQNLDLSIALIDSLTYSKPFYENVLSKKLQANLKTRFYNRKKRKVQQVYRKRNLLIEQIERVDPIASSLIIFKPLSWSEKTISGDYIHAYPELWRNHCIITDEAVISYHGLCNAQSSQEREWKKIVCFSLFAEDKKLQLNHYVIDDPLLVSQLQKESQELIKNVYSQSSRSSLSLISISQALIQPMLQDLPARRKKLLIMGNDEFQFMPWAAMYLGEDEDSMESRWLVDDFNIRVTPSLSLLLLLKQREDRRNTSIHPRLTIAGVSRYPETQRFLYWSGFETDSITKIYNVQSIKDEAVDRYFADEFCSSEIIHFSGHADYQIDESLQALDRTYLCLYHQNLSAAQILDGALQSSTAKAMVLSACLTGTGDLIGAGSEILGLERSLFYAGLSAIITTLWQVDDVATSILMIKFHSIWKEHNNSLDRLSSSLAGAQLWLKNATWQNIKYEIEDFEDAIEECIEICSTFIKDEVNKNEGANILSLKTSMQYCIKIKQCNDNKRPFQHPYYWAAFQVKGVG